VQDNAQHWSALDELLVYQLLRTRHEDVRHEESWRRRLWGVWTRSLARVCGGHHALQKEEREKEWRTYATVADALNERIRLQGFMIHLVTLELARTPPLESRRAIWESLSVR
jgi:hypothetical protein